MVSDEALVPEPQNIDKNKRAFGWKRKSIKRVIKAYFLAICVLFLLVVMLCSYNLIIYDSYKNIKIQFDGTFSKVKAIVTDNRSLSKESKIIKSENDSLKTEFEKFKAENEKVTKTVEEIKRQNEELDKENKELKEDNIALQNSLKMAAAVGIKPQSYTKFNGLTSRSELDRGEYVGQFLGTAYTPSKNECGNNNGITNSGQPIIPGISLAVDGKYWPLGTVFYIKGLGFVVAMDTGSAIKGKNRFDFAVFDRDFALTLGSRYWDVNLVKLGDGKVSKVEF